jgi:hypothetical protein
MPVQLSFQPRISDPSILAHISVAQFGRIPAARRTINLMTLITAPIFGFLFVTAKPVIVLVLGEAVGRRSADRSTRRRQMCSRQASGAQVLLRQDIRSSNV